LKLIGRPVSLFSDGETLVCTLKKDQLSQSFTMQEKTITSIKIGSLIKGYDALFPDLTQLEAFGMD